MDPPLKIHEVQSRSEFDAVMDCAWEGFHGQETFWAVWFPVDKTAYLGDPRPDLAGAIAESKDRMWAEHQANPSSHWVYITEDGRRAGTEETAGPEDGKATASSRVYPSAPALVIGSCQWRVYQPPTNPYPGSKVPEIKCAAWKRDEIAEEMTSALVGLLVTPRVKYMARPHVGLSWMSVRPTHRRLGLGRALMAWGSVAADSAGIECILDASPDGQRLYESCGWRVVGTYDAGELPIDVDVEGHPESEERATRKRAFARYYGLDRDYTHTSMWRPPMGVWPEGVDAVEAFRAVHKIED